MRTALGGMAALICGAAIGVATWMIELRSIPPGCRPCTGSVCLMAACLINYPTLLAFAVVLGLVAMGLALLAIRRWAL